MSEQELDDFFQKSLGDKQIPFNLTAWEKMEAKLEADKKKKLLRKRLLLIALLLFSSIGIYQLTINNQNSKSENLELGIKQPKINNQQQTRNKEQETTEKEQPDNQTTQQSKKDKDNNYGVAETLASNGKRKSFNPLPKFNQLFFKNDSTVNSENRAANRLESQNENQTTSKEQLNNSTIKQSATNNQQQTTEKEQSNNLTIKQIIIQERQFSLAKLDTPKLPELSKVEVKQEKITLPKDPMPFGRFNVGLLFSPDWSSIGFENIKQTGYKMGLEFEYQPIKRLSIASGLVFSRLLYNSEGYEYKVPYGYWNNTTRKLPEVIWGTCDALEVPINLRYALFLNERSKFFISTGLSSYWMLSESYKYEYYWSKPSIVDGWAGKNKSKHYFGIANFSLGYAGKLGNRTFWQVEPFVKLPLGGVGWGNINLSSTGAFLSIRYVIAK